MGKPILFKIIMTVFLCFGLLLPAWADFSEDISTGELYRATSPSYTKFHKAARHGDTDAQFALGCMYFNGSGTDVDKGKAVRWFHKVAEHGHIEAQKNLGFIYARGDGVEQDQAEAANWFRLAAEQGDAQAQFSLWQHVL